MIRDLNALTLNANAQSSEILHWALDVVDVGRWAFARSIPNMRFILFLTLPLYALDQLRSSGDRDR